MRIAVIGTGLIGASVGLAARERLGAEVVGWDPDPSAALAAGAVDRAAGSVAEALDGAEAAFVAVPVGALAETVAAVLAAAGERCVVTDTGSVKRSVVAAVDDERFVGGHPLAGGEASGAAHARADLFDGATWYLTPTQRSSGLRLQELHRIIAGLGARPEVVDPETHDRLMAAVSHLPHVLANVLVGQASAVLGGDRMPAIGPSFRDATRVAGSHPALWDEIYAANAEALAAEIDQALGELADIRDRLRAGEPLGDWQALAAERRAALTAAAAGEAQAELRAVVPNRPGIVAEITLTLAREGIGISDLSLGPAADMATGELAIWVPEARAARARELLAELGLAT